MNLLYLCYRKTAHRVKARCAVFYFTAVLNGTDTAKSLGVFCSKSHLSNSRGNKHQCPPKKQKIGCFPLQVTSKQFERKPTSIPSQKRGSLGVLCRKSPPSYSRDKKRQFPPKKEVTWVISAPSHLQVIREAININALPKKRKIGCSLPQVTFKQFERKPTSIPSQKRGSLGVLCRKSLPSNSRDKKRHLPPKKRRSSMATPPMLTGRVRTSSGVNRLGA